MSHGGKRLGAGRKVGSTPKDRTRLCSFYEDIVDHPTYKQKLKNRALAGELSPQVEVMLHHYARGKPVEQRNPDDEAFIDDLMTVVWQHVPSAEGRQAIRAVIQAHLSGNRLRVVA
jgi:hypothetical protein